MAKGSKTGGKDFEKGQPAGPGRPPLPSDIKDARKLTTLEFERVANRFLWMSREEIQVAIKAPGTTMLEMMVASIVAQAAQKGDQQRLDFVLNRLIGKVQDRIEVVSPKPFILNLLEGGQIIAGVSMPNGGDIVPLPVTHS